MSTSQAEPGPAQQRSHPAQGPTLKVGRCTALQKTLQIYWRGRIAVWKLANTTSGVVQGGVHHTITRPLCPRVVQVWVVVARYESWLGPLLGWGATAASYVHRKV